MMKINILAHQQKKIILTILLVPLVNKFTMN